MSEFLEKKTDQEPTVDNLKLPYMVFAVSIIFTLGISYIFYQSAKSKDQVRFNTAVNRIQNTIETRIGLYIVLLKSGRGFIEANKNLERKDFANFVESLELSKNYRGVQGIGYSLVFKSDEKDFLIKKMQSEGISDFKVFPESERDTHQSVIYLEPFNERNSKAIGYDMTTEEKRRTALESARDSGEATATSLIALLQDDGQQPQKGFLIYLPVYKDNEENQTVESRRKNVRGFIYSPFKAGDFLSEVHNLTNNSDLKVKIYDGEISPENLLAASFNNDNSTATPALDEHLFTQSQLNVAGRNWTIRYETLPVFNVQSSLGWMPVIFAVGVIFSLILFGLTYWEAASRAKVQKIVSELYDSEIEKKKLLVKEQEARMSAESANRAKDEFISVISHELRTPLNAIAGWSRILKATHLSDEKRHTALEKIEKNLRHQTELIDDMINYSQMVSDTLDAKKQNFVVSEIFNEVFNDLKNSAEEKNIKLEKQNTLNGCIVSGDKQKMRIVFENILSNAVKFTPEGGKVYVQLNCDTSVISFSVQDNGIGIKSEFLPHIFEQFRQADSTMTRRHGGMGLGLAISKHIVKLHNGTIEAQSKGEGEGTTIVVRLPLKDISSN